MHLSAISTASSCPVNISPGSTPKSTKGKKVAESILSQSPTSKTAKFENNLSIKNILKKVIVSKVCELPRFTARTMHAIYSKVQKSLSALFVIKKLDSRIIMEETLIETIEKQEGPHETTLIKLRQGIAFLRQQRRKWVNRLLEFRKAPPGFFGIISTCLSAIYTLGSFTKSMSSVLLTRLHLAASWIGGISGGISIVFGGIEIFLGIKKLRDVSKVWDQITLSIDKLEEEEKRFVPHELQRLWTTCSKLQRKKLLIEQLKARKHYTRAIFQTIAGSFAIVGGALGIASVCTAGWAAVGLSIAAGAAGAAGLGVAICSYLRTRPLKKQIEAIRTFSEQDLTHLSKDIQHCSPEQKKQLADLLDLNFEELDKSPETTLKTNFFNVTSKT